MTYEEILQEIKNELDQATALHGSFNSTYEGYAVIQEEVEELWDEIKKKSHERSIPKMRKEAIQIAAMAARFLIDIKKWTKEEVLLHVEDASLNNIRNSIITHHDGYGRLKEHLDRLWLFITKGYYDSCYSESSPAFYLVVFMVGFIFDTMNGEYEEKPDDETFGKILAESVLGR